MKPVRQTIFGKTDGNCHAAAIASVLELPLDSVPNFCAHPGRDWREKMQRWLAQHGVCLLCLDLQNDGALPAGLASLADGVLCILGGKSPRGDFLHSVVGRYVLRDGQHSLECVHDPHPDETFLDGPPQDVDFFVTTAPGSEAAEAVLTLKRLQKQQVPWVQHNFGDRPAYWPLLGAVEELGELAHAHLKEEQGIRVSEDHVADARDAIGDTIIFLADYCTARGFDLQEIVEETWAKVKKRDWKADPARAAETEATP